MPVAKCLVTALHATCVGGALLLHGAEKAHEASDAGIPHFDVFLQKFNRSYDRGSAEFRVRKALYNKRAAIATAQNRKVHGLWSAGVNYLWDSTEEEFSKLRGWRRAARPSWESHGSTGLVQVKRDRSLAEMPEGKSWSQLTSIQRVTDQGPCGSCWAIASSEVLSAHTEIHTSVVRTFAPQQLVSCVPNPNQCGGDGGCKGATVELAYAWVMENGLADEDQVPYGSTDTRCSSQASVQDQTTAMPVLSQISSSTSFGMSGWERLPMNEYDPVIRALVEKGPVAVSVAADPWDVYEAGIFNGCPGDVVIDHSVVLIGFGSSGGESEEANAATKFWEIKNSWGLNWGERGNIRLLRQEPDDMHCGTDNKPELGTACKGGPKEVTVCGMCGILYDTVIPLF